MATDQKTSSSSQASFLEERTLGFLSTWGKFIIPGVLGLLLLFFAFYFYFLRAEPKEAVYLTAEAELLQFLEGDKNVIPEAKFNQIFAELPALKDRYAAAVAQKLIREKRDEQLAVTYGEFAIQEATTIWPSAYEAYSQASLLMLQGQKQEALEKTLQLKAQLQETMDQKGNFPYRLLFADNLLRLALLKQELGLVLEEQLAWKEYQAYVKKEGIGELMGVAFQENDISLNDYILNRLNSLSKLK